MALTLSQSTDHSHPPQNHTEGSSAFAADANCEWLDWDSRFFDRRIGRVRTRRLTHADWPLIADWIARERIDCLYFLADADDPPTIRLAESVRFGLVDMRVSFARRLDPTVGAAVDARHGVRVRADTSSDLVELCTIARASLRHSRFYFDDHFTNTQCEALYETWLRQSCEGRSACVLTGEVDGRVAGFITCDQIDRSGSIGLIAVNEASRGRGLGARLVSAALSWFGQQGHEHVGVVAQGRNPAALRLYEASGFRVENIQLWYHRWSSGGVLARG